MFGNWGFRLAHGVRWRYRWIRGRAGEFAAPEQSERARDLTSHWDANWADADPDAVVWGQRARHVRFHSLPGSKRYADTDAERAEILRRHLVVLSELLGSDDTSGLVCIAADYGRRDLVSGWTRTMLPASWPWRAIPESGANGLSTFGPNANLRAPSSRTSCASVADDDGRAGRSSSPTVKSSGSIARTTAERTSCCRQALTAID